MITEKAFSENQQSHSRLSSDGQQFFRSFIEQFTPLVLRHEQKHNSRNVTIKNGQSSGINHRWDKKNHDCAGFVRYLFWEALQPHSETFLRIYPEIRALQHPVDYTEFQRIRSKWTQNNFTASGLIAQTRFLGRNLSIHVKSGDLLYFQSGELKIRHVMLVICSGENIYLVYHTGDSRNELRIRTLADMATLSDEWHPESGNPVFRGIYRPAFLD